jgi:hypothetical protein
MRQNKSPKINTVQNLLALQTQHGTTAMALWQSQIGQFIRVPIGCTPNPPAQRLPHGQVSPGEQTKEGESMLAPPRGRKNSSRKFYGQEGPLPQGIRASQTEQKAARSLLLVGVRPEVAALLKVHETRSGSGTKRHLPPRSHTSGSIMISTVYPMVTRTTATTKTQPSKNGKNRLLLANPHGSRMDIASGESQQKLPIIESLLPLFPFPLNFGHFWHASQSSECIRQPRIIALCYHNLPNFRPSDGRQNSAAINSTRSHTRCPFNKYN